MFIWNKYSSHTTSDSPGQSATYSLIKSCGVAFLKELLSLSDSGLWVSRKRGEREKKEEAEQEVTEMRKKEYNSSIFDPSWLVMHLASGNWKTQGECELPTESSVCGRYPLSITRVSAGLQCWRCIVVFKRQFWTPHKTVLHPYNLHLDAAEISYGSKSKLSLQFQSKFLFSCDVCYSSYTVPLHSEEI